MGQWPYLRGQTKLRGYLLMSKIITRAERTARLSRPLGRVSPRSPIGLGTAIKMVTSAVGIKPCGGCNKRGAEWDKKVPNINPFSK